VLFCFFFPARAIMRNPRFLTKKKIKRSADFFFSSGAMTSTGSRLCRQGGGVHLSLGGGARTCFFFLFLPDGLTLFSVLKRWPDPTFFFSSFGVRQVVREVVLPPPFVFLGSNSALAQEHLFLSQRCVEASGSFSVGPCKGKVPFSPPLLSIY